MSFLFRNKVKHGKSSKNTKTVKKNNNIQLILCSPMSLIIQINCHSFNYNI